MINGLMTQVFEPDGPDVDRPDFVSFPYEN